MAVHNGDEFWERGGLKFASHRWHHHLLSGIKEKGGDNLLFSQHGAFMMKKLTDFVSRSFDSWIDSIIMQATVFMTRQAIWVPCYHRWKVGSFQVCKYGNNLD